MPLLIAGLAVGVAGGVMGGMQKDAQAKAQYMAQKIQIDRQNFQNSLANDRQTEQIAQQNVNRRLRNEKITSSALENRFNATRALNQRTSNAYIQANMMANASEAMLESQITGKLGNPTGGTAKLLQRQAMEARRRKDQQINRRNLAEQENIAQSYENALSQRDLLSHDEANVYIPGSTGIEPASGAGLVNGLFSGISNGLALGSSMDSFATKLGSPAGGSGLPFVGPPAP